MFSKAYILVLLLFGVVPASASEAQLADPALVDLGRHLYFEPRLSGDGSISCASCHDLSKHGSDGLPLSTGYPGTQYFRRTPSIYNASKRPRFYWDGRLSGKDMPTLVRDHISEAHFMQADGRLILERLRQIPFYETTFKSVMGGEPSYGKILKAITTFVQTLDVDNAPYDRFISGEEDALNPEQKRGLSIFEGKAKCSECHSGVDLSDGKSHNTGIPTNPNLFLEPQRHITFRRFMKTFGVSNYSSRSYDAGLEIITHDSKDDRKFMTPSLRNLNDVGPYMHNGTIATLEDVIIHYDIELTPEERSDLVAFLESLKGTPAPVAVPEPKEYEERVLGEN